MAKILILESDKSARRSIQDAIQESGRKDIVLVSDLDSALGSLRNHKVLEIASFCTNFRNIKPYAPAEFTGKLSYASTEKYRSFYAERAIGYALEEIEIPVTVFSSIDALAIGSTFFDYGHPDWISQVKIVSKDRFIQELRADFGNERKSG